MIHTIYRAVFFDDQGEWIILSINFNQYANLTDGMEGKSIDIPGGEYVIIDSKTFTDGNVKYAILNVTKKEADGLNDPAV